ncbi:MAG: AMP-binding enzyme [Acidimicrobiales bacterium]
MRALVAEAVAPFAAPKEVVTVEALPRTAIGKVRRDALP